MENLFLLCFVHSSKLKKLSNRDIHQTYIYLLGWVMEEGGGGEGRRKLNFLAHKYPLSAHTQSGVGHHIWSRGYDFKFL